MKGLIKHAATIRVVMAAAMLGLTGCQNGNLFGKLHSSGSSGNTETLFADGDQALRNQDYSSALTLYERILDGDPRNSRAMYGAAAASAGVSGLNLGQILANVFNHDGSLNTSSLSLGEAITSNVVGVGSSASATLTNSIVSGILEAVRAQSFQHILTWIHDLSTGASDGVIAADDVGMLIDGTICYLCYAAGDLISQGIADIVNDNGTMKVVSATTAHAYCSDSANSTKIIQTGQEIAFAYFLINNASKKSSSSLIARFRDDIYKVVNEGLDSDGISDLDPACVSVLATDGITATGFTTRY